MKKLLYLCALLLASGCAERRWTVTVHSASPVVYTATSLVYGPGGMWLTDERTGQTIYVSGTFTVTENPR